VMNDNVFLCDYLALFQGKCKKRIQESVPRLWNIIEDLTVNSLGWLEFYTVFLWLSYLTVAFDLILLC